MSAIKRSKKKSRIEKIFAYVFSVGSKTSKKVKKSDPISGAILIVLGLLLLFLVRIPENWIQDFSLTFFGFTGSLFLSLSLIVFGIKKSLGKPQKLDTVFFGITLASLSLAITTSQSMQDEALKIFGNEYVLTSSKNFGVVAGLIISFFEIALGDTLSKIIFWGLFIFSFVKFFAPLSLEIKNFAKDLEKIWKNIFPKKKQFKINSIKTIPKNIDLKEGKTEKIDESPAEISEFSAAKVEIEEEPDSKSEFTYEDDISSPAYQRRILEVEDWSFPSVNLLEVYKGESESGNVTKSARDLVKTLENFNIDVEMEEVNVGPTVTQFAFRPSAGVKLTKITSLASNIAMALKARSVRVEAPIPGRDLVGIEVPNLKSAIVGMKELYDEMKKIAKEYELNVTLGKSISGKPEIANIAKMPHMLVAGATGTGKSVFLNSVLASLLMQHSPETLRLILVDPKRVEFTPYEGLPHLLSPVITEPQKTLSSLKWLVSEMERRYKMLAKVGKRNLADYNEIVSRENKLPLIVLVIDELADLMMVLAKEVESSIVRLAQMARAVGIHLILATQRPSVNVITGLIKANVPARISFAVSSQTDSRTIIDIGGAEKLLGRGDMLFMSPNSVRLLRVQAPFISDAEIGKIIAHWKKQLVSLPDDLEESSEERAGNSISGDVVSNFQQTENQDELFSAAKQVALQAGSVSTSFLQRRLKVGYARASRIMDELEAAGLVSEYDGTPKPRKIIRENF